METEALNKAVAGRWFASFWGERYDLAIVDELARTDVFLQYSNSSVRHGHFAVKLFMAGFRQAFPDLQFVKIGGLIADRDFVVIRWEGKGTHTGDAFHDFNIGPLPKSSGRKLNLSGYTAVRLANGMIAEEAVWPMERRAQLRPIAGGLVLGVSTAAPANV